MNTKHLKAKILDLAIRGKLVPQDPSEGNAADLLNKIREEKNILIEQKKIKADKNSSFIIKADDGKHYEQFFDGSLIDIEDEIPFAAPKQWSWVKLGSISFITKLAGFEYSKNISPNLVNKGIPLFKGKNIQNSEIIYSFENYIPESLSDELLRSQINKKCILTPYVGTIGNIGIHNKPGKYHLGSNVGKIELFDLGITTEEFIVIYLKSSYGYIQLTKHMKATAQESISMEALRDVILPIPPLSEQQRIISTIEKAVEQIDIIEKNKLNLKTYIKQTKSKVLDLAIHGKLVEQNPGEGNAFELLEKIRNEKIELVKQKKIKEDKKSSFIIKAEDGKHYEQFADGTLKDIEDEIPFEIPENWCWCRLREIGNWQSGCTPDKSRKDFYDKADIPWLNSGDLTDSYIETIPHYVSQIAFDEKKMKLNEAGSVCIAMYGATIGKLGILTKSATTNQAVLVCNKLHLSDSKYLFYFLKSHKKEYIQAGFGGAQPNISKEKVEPTLFPLPPLDEQKRIVDRIEQIFEQLDILEKSLGE